jgi:hypothetical protein
MRSCAGIVDVGLTIPTFLVLIIVAISIHSAMTIGRWRW